MDFPVLVWVAWFFVLLLAAEAGNALRIKLSPMNREERHDFDFVLGAVLTLLGILIGFAFSMAATRYDSREHREAEEAIAIGTEYMRAGLLPGTDTATVHALLKRYLQQRILFYKTRNPTQLARVDSDTGELQKQLWSAVRPAATAQPVPLDVLVVSGMNDVLNSESYTEAAWSNHIPAAAWVLMAAISACCVLLNSYRTRHKDWRTLLILPIVISVSFFLIADIDSPRGGVIRVVPENLVRLERSLSRE